MTGKNTITVKVLRSDIEDAVRNSSTKCMISEAVKRSVPNASFVSTDVQSIRWTNKERGERYVYFTPRVAQENLLKFDGGIDPKPFKFYLRNVAYTLETNKEQDSEKRLENKRKYRKKMKKAKESATASMLSSGKKREFGLRAFDKLDMADAELP